MPASAACCTAGMTPLTSIATTMIPSTPLGDVGLDRVVLRRGIVVGVEDHELGAGLLGRCVAPSFIWLKNSACWLICTSATVGSAAWAKAVAGRNGDAQHKTWRRIDDA